MPTSEQTYAQLYLENKLKEGVLRSAIMLHKFEKESQDIEITESDTELWSWIQRTS